MLFKATILILFYLFVFTCGTTERNIEGKTVIVTGAAQGIGYAIADSFLDNGAKFLIILDKNYTRGTEAVKELQTKYGKDRITYIYCDVVRNLPLWDEIVTLYGPIEVFVNDAGILNDFLPEETMLTNSAAPVQWCMKFREHARIDKGGHGGTIINIASQYGYSIEPFSVAYTASKYSVIGLSKSLGHEYNYRYTGVRVMALCPGFTYTSLTGRLINQASSLIWGEHIDDFKKLTTTMLKQQASDVGKAAVNIFKNGDSGTAWSIIGGNLYVAPFSETITVETIDAL